MNLYLVRHCEAVDGPRNDPARGLTEEGVRQAHVIAEFLRREIGYVDLILTSPFHRALDTALVIAEALGCQRLKESGFLEPDVNPELAWSDIQTSAGNVDDVLIVTHHPLVSELMAKLSGTNTAEEHVKHGAIAHIHTDAGTLRWFVVPRLIERDEDGMDGQKEELAEAAESLAALAESLLSETADIELAEEWVTINGQHIDIGVDGEVSKSLLAKLNYRGGTKAEQDIAEQTEHELAVGLGMTKSADNKPFDLFTKTVGVECKALTSGGNDKITMKADAVARKDAGVKAMKLKRTYTVVVDKRPKGVGTSTGETRYFVRAGYGSFRTGNMTEVADLPALKRFMKL